MKINLTYGTTLLATVAAAVAVVAAPTASALPKTCVGYSPGMTCRSAVNIEITKPGPDVSFFPSATMPYLLGGH